MRARQSSGPVRSRDNRVAREGPGQVVVVTGASSGIGRLAARRFAARGDNLVLVARAAGPLADVAGECEAAGGVAMVMPADVAVEGDVWEVGRRTIQRFGRIDVWVNNAGVMAFGEASRETMPTHKQVVKVNLFGVLHGSTVATELMDRERGGVIINVASLYGRMTSPYVTGYVASKYGVVGLSRVLRQELAGTGIRICTVLPGSMDTPIFRHAANFTGRQPKPVPPVGNPDRVARKIVALSDRPHAEVIVGQTHRLLSWGQRLTPGPYGRLAPKAMRWLGLGEDSSETTEGNVFQPMPDWDRPTDRWRRPVLRVGSAAGVAVALAGAVGVARTAGWPMRRRTS